MIIDTHFHYISLLERNPDAVLDDCLTGIEIGLNGGDLEKRIRKIGENKYIFLSVGAGPWVLDRVDFSTIDDEINKIEEDIKKFGADAIGECGIDNHWKYGTLDLQKELFEKQCILAREYDLPLLIHSREADNELLDFAAKGYIGEKTVMHCFSSSIDIANVILDKGCYLSFAGNVTYKQNKHIQESAKHTPLDRILVETDSPYLTPMPKRHEINNPRNTELTIQFIANLKGMDKETLKERIHDNFMCLMDSSESKVKRDITTLSR